MVISSKQAASGPAAAEMEFCLLGPLAVRRGGVAVPIATGKQRAVLATLLLSAGRAVGVAELMEALWGTQPPSSARVTLQNYLVRLRRTLGEAGWDRIRTVPGGYLIRVAGDELDVSRFESLLTAAHSALQRQAWETAAAQAGQALGLWYGEPLTDAGSELLLAREMPRLTEMRVQAAETRLEAEFHLGRGAGMIGDLRRLASLHPLRERVYQLLMLALCREDRRGEALTVYQQARRVLVEELGTEPGAGLRELHEQILAADLTLVPPLPARPAETLGPGPEVPRQLPPRVQHFTGRADELATLTASLEPRNREEPQAATVWVVSGTAGAGKTALAVHWAHQVVHRFPDGQLQVNLRGYDPDQPVPAADAVAGFLRALGVAGTDIPADAQERTARYRSLLAGRRVLVLLDNAGSANQVRPLLPGSASCTTVVTSRDVLPGLVARDGARRLHLDVLPPAEAVRLLGILIGGRAATNPAATAALAGQCCRLPLAIRLVAELAGTHPAAALGDLVAEMTDRHRRLDLLDAGGDAGTAVRAVFSWSYQRLSPPAARAFRFLGLLPGADFGQPDVAALLGTTSRRAGDLLATLVRTCLVQATPGGRYQAPDLLRAYAAELAETHDSEPERQAALTRLHRAGGCLFP